MTPRTPVVIDSNVWISGMLTTSDAPVRVVRQVIGAAPPVFSADTFAELEERLWRPKFDRYVSMERRKALLVDLQSIALWVEIPPDLAAQTYCRDATDDKFIHAALVAKAPWLITGDMDLLVLADAYQSHDLRIVSPADWPGLS